MRLRPAILAVMLLAWSAHAQSTRPAFPIRVLVLPLAFSGDNAQYAWAGDATSRYLSAQLARVRTVDSLSPAGLPVVTDKAAALAEGRKHEATIVVFGEVQSSGRQLRVSVQVLDVHGGRSLGTMDSTGLADELFRLQDEVATRLIDLMPRPYARPPIAPDVPALTLAADGPLTAARPARGPVERPADRIYFSRGVYAGPVCGPRPWIGYPHPCRGPVLVIWGAYNGTHFRIRF